MAHQAIANDGSTNIGNYLYWLYTHNPIHAQRGIINIAWLLDPDWVPTEMMRVPLLGDDPLWHHSDGVPQHLIREAFDIDRDAIFRDFFSKLNHAP